MRKKTSAFENYLIIDYLRNKNNKCLLIFSSNGLDDSGNKEKYEFMNVCSSKRITRYFSRIIFVKDTRYSFYIEGINKKINSVSKLIELLKKITTGYIVYTTGFSSGGYMATLCGIYLNNVERVYSFGGVLNVLDWHGSFNNYNFADKDVVKNSSADKKKYFDLRPKIKLLPPHSYFVYAGFADADKPILRDLKRAQNSRINILVFDTKQHGHYNWSYDYKYLFTFDYTKLDKTFNKFKNKIVSRRDFSIFLQGPFRYISNFFLQQFRRTIRILFKKRNK